MSPLLARLDAIRDCELELLFAPTFTWLTRNAAKLLYAIETINRPAIITQVAGNRERAQQLAYLIQLLGEPAPSGRG